MGRIRNIIGENIKSFVKVMEDLSKDIPEGNTFKSNFFISDIPENSSRDESINSGDNKDKGDRSYDVYK